MKYILKSIIILSITICLLSSCSNINSSSNSNSNINSETDSQKNVVCGDVPYSVSQINDQLINQKKIDEDIFIYFANEHYIAYGLSYPSEQEGYYLTKSLNLYDYKNNKIVKSISFKEPSYVGDCIVLENKLIYNNVPVKEIADDSSSWEIWETSINNKGSKLRLEGTSSFCDNYPRFTLLDDTVIFSYEDRKPDGSFIFGCSALDSKITPAFKENKVNDEKQNNSFLSLRMNSNGKEVFAFTYSNGQLYQTFFNSDGIISKIPFKEQMYHSGMLKDGLVVSKINENNPVGKRYKICILSPNGKETEFIDRNEDTYCRLTSSDKNHFMAINGHFNLYLFKYHNNELSRTKISIDPDTDNHRTEPFYVGNNQYLVVNQFNDSSVKLHLVSLT